MYPLLGLEVNLVVLLLLFRDLPLASHFSCAATTGIAAGFYYSTPNFPSNTCMACDTGFSSKDGLTCQDCAPFGFSSGGAPCTACSAGTVSETGAQTQNDCASGRVIPFTYTFPYNPQLHGYTTQIVSIIIAPNTTFGDVLATLTAAIPSSSIQNEVYMSFPQGSKGFPPGGSAVDPPFTVLSGRTIAAIIEEIRPHFPGGFDLTLQGMGGA